jgi:uncharacterized phage-associated protein
MLSVSNPPYDALAIANEFLDLASKEGTRLDHLKLQKLLYCAHGWYLALTGKPLLREHVEAWAYGPVVPTVYHEFKRFGSGEIFEPALRLGRDETGKPALVAHRVSLKDYDQAVIQQVWQAYRNFTGLQMSSLTHTPGSAWDKTIKANPGRIGVDIPDDQIRAEFSSQLQAA